MTFTTSLKEEISQNEINVLEARNELEGFLFYSLKDDNDISLTLENGAVARRIYKNIKLVYNSSPSITIRNQKRFRVKQIYILSLPDKKFNNTFNYNDFDSDEEKIAFVRGAFLAIGNISNPSTSGYHLEFICNDEAKGEVLIKLLNDFNLTAKMVQRKYKFVVYLKVSEQISDLLKLFKATNSMFYFEDVRIYKDHKNMVNRLNNCEIFNQTKTITAGMKQKEEIDYLKKNDLISILDEKTLIVMNAREKYPESSLSELAQIITLEYGYKIGKSGVNHHFIKISEIVKRHKQNNL